MNTHEQLHQYFRDSCRNDTGSIKEAYELSLAAEKHYAEQEAEIVNLKEKIASQANMISKLQVKAGYVDLLRDALQKVVGDSKFYFKSSDDKATAKYGLNCCHKAAHKALEQTKES